MTGSATHTHTHTHLLAKNLVYHRRLKCLSARKLCDQMAPLFYMNQKRYSGYEEGRNEPDIMTLKNLATFYNITIDDLCFKKYEM